MSANLCVVEDCDLPYSGMGYCKRHYDQMRTHGYIAEVKEGHGMHKSSEYESWMSMKTRCYNINHIHYKSYGGRGITVCDTWKDDFTAFYNYIGKKPSKRHTLDRIDNGKGYTPGNVRWATPREQAVNRSNANKYGYPGISTYETKTKGTRWRANMYINGKLLVRGKLNSLEEAIQARKDMESLL